MATFAELKKKIEKLPDVFSYWTGKPASSKELDALEKSTGAKLPKELRKLLETWGALVVDVDASLWPRPKKFDVLPAWQFSYGFKVLGVGKGVQKELSISGSTTPAMKKRKLVPVIQRFNAPFTAVLDGKTLSQWEPKDGSVEAHSFDVIELILDEIAALEEGVSKLQSKLSGTDQLMQRIRDAKWKDPALSDALNALQERPPEELAPVLEELAKKTFPKGTHSMGVLDVIAAAGPKGYAGVQKLVHAHYGKHDNRYVLQLMGKVSDFSPAAVKIYKTGLASKNVCDAVADLLSEHAQKKEARAFVKDIDKRLDGKFSEPTDSYPLIGALGRLAGATYEDRILKALAAAKDDDALYELITALHVPAVKKSKQPILDAIGKMKMDEYMAFNSIRHLAEGGLIDKPLIERVTTAFAKHKGEWVKSVKALRAML